MRRCATKSVPAALALIMIVCLASCPTTVSPDLSDSDSAEEAVTVSVGPDGGSFEIDAEMTVIVPPGAVDTQTQLSVSRLAPARWSPAFGDYQEQATAALAAFAISPGGITFGQPLTAEFTSVQAEPVSVPLVHAVDLGSDDHRIAHVVAEFDQPNNRLSVWTSRSGAYVVEANRAWKDRIVPSGAVALAVVRATTGGCREGVIVVETQDSIVACSQQDCQITESTVSVQFMSCDGQPTETATLRETSPGCEPKVIVTPASATMTTESTMTVDALVELGCAGCEGETVTFSAEGVGGVNPQSATTESAGVAGTTLYSYEEEGTVTLRAAASVRYPAREIIIDGSVIEAFYRTEEATGRAAVTVEEQSIDPVYETWSGVLSFRQWGDMLYFGSPDDAITIIEDTVCTVDITASVHFTGTVNRLENYLYNIAAVGTVSSSVVPGYVEFTHNYETCYYLYKYTYEIHHIDRVSDVTFPYNIYDGEQLVFDSDDVMTSATEQFLLFRLSSNDEGLYNGGPDNLPGYPRVSTDIAGNAASAIRVETGTLFADGFREGTFTGATGRCIWYDGEPDTSLSVSWTLTLERIED